MTPKEKATDLLNKFSERGFHSDFDHCKYCAEVCVDELMKYVPDTAWEYWQKVKEEINNL